jgi:hypothetical protein
MTTLEVFRNRVRGLRPRRVHESAEEAPGDHQDLRVKLARTQSGIAEGAEALKRGRRGAGARRASLRELASLELALIRHFKREESGLRDVLGVAPRHYSRAESLERQHAVLSRELRDICALGEVCGPSAERWAELEWRLAGFSRRLQVHERAENDLASDVFLEDIGTMD